MKYYEKQGYLHCKMINQSLWLWTIRIAIELGQHLLVKVNNIMTHQQLLVYFCHLLVSILLSVAVLLQSATLYEVWNVMATTLCLKHPRSMPTLHLGLCASLTCFVCFCLFYVGMPQMILPHDYSISCLNITYIFSNFDQFSILLNIPMKTYLKPLHCY